jgi:predicted tellurium resistance membrane protein TerC
VIRAREGLARLLCLRCLTILAATLVAVLVLFVGVHPISDDVVEHADLVCAAAVLVLGLAVTLLRRTQDLKTRVPAKDTVPLFAAPLAGPAPRLAVARSLPLRR